MSVRTVLNEINIWIDTLRRLRKGFPCGSAGKESTCNAGDLGLIPGLGSPLEKGKGYPLQYSGLENSMDCIVHGVPKSRTGLSNFHFHWVKQIALPNVVWWGRVLIWSVEDLNRQKNWRREFLSDRLPLSWDISLFSYQWTQMKNQFCLGLQAAGFQTVNILAAFSVLRPLDWNWNYTISYTGSLAWQLGTCQPPQYLWTNSL